MKMNRSDNRDPEVAIYNLDTREITFKRCSELFGDGRTANVDHSITLPRFSRTMHIQFSFKDPYNSMVYMDERMFNLPSKVWLGRLIGDYKWLYLEGEETGMITKADIL